MANLKKKLAAVFLALLAAVSLSAGVYFLQTEKVTLAETEALSSEYFNISNGVFLGLKDTSLVDGDFFTIDLSDTGVQRINANALLNCTRLTEIIIPDSVTHIGQNAFMGCDNLKSVTLPNSAATIDSRAFSGCSSLLKVTIPERIDDLGTAVFENCYRLVEIYNKSEAVAESYSEDLESWALNVYTDAEGSSKLVTKDEYTYYVDGETVYLVDYKGAEGDAISLKLPKDYEGIIYKIYYGTFRNHTGIKNIYLPETNIQIDENAFVCTSEELIIIAPDKASYNKFVIVVEDAMLAYAVKLNLYYGGADHDEESRLNIGYEYKYSDGIWKYVGEEGMPVQKGYKTSVWYSDSYLTSRLDGENINELLLLGDTTLYALYVEKPSLSGKVLTYTGTEIKIEDALVGWTDELANACDITVTHSPGNNGIIREAGSYTLEVALKEMYGEWAEPPVPVTVTVGSAEYDVAKLQWGSLLSNNTVSPLDPVEGTVHLYIYNNIPYYLPNPGMSNPTYAQVINSCLNFTNTQYTVVLADDTKYGGEFEVTDYTSNTIKDAGIYKVQATIKSNDNCTLAFNDSDEAKSKGLRLVSGEGTTTLTIEKTVYIVSANKNGLILGGSTYSIPSSWTYGGGTPIAPNTIFGTASELITFTLERSDLNANRYKLISGSGKTTFSHGEFDTVINSSIPAGDYVLTITLKDLNDYNGSNYEGGVFRFNFTVDNKAFGGADTGNVTVDSVYQNEFDPSPLNVQLNDVDISSLNSEPHVGRSGIWLGSEYDVYYTGFEITYRVVSQSSDSNGYYPAEYYKDNLFFAPRSAGAYTIYYSISSPSFAPKTGSYLLVVYYYLNSNDITVPSVEYSGEAQTPNFNSDFYHAVYFNSRSDEVIAAERVLGKQGTQDYINAGDYSVALVIEDKYYVKEISNYIYRWYGDSVNDRYLLIIFTVHGAKTTGSVSVTDWEYGTFDPAKNIITYSSNRDDYYPIKQDGPKPEFFLQSTSGGKLYPIEEFNTAGSGFYKLIAKFESANNFEAGDIVYSPLYISPARISWVKAPEVANWKYGDYATMFSLPNPKLNTAFSEEIEKEIIEGAYFLKEGSNTHYSSIADLLDKSGELPAGKYTLVYPHPKSLNFAAIDYTVNFEVLRADNFWKTTPVITDKIYGQIAADFKPEYEVNFGSSSDVIIRYNTGSGAWGPLAVDEFGYVRVGHYTMEAYVPGTSDYEEMTFTWSFEIKKAQNSWKHVPNVASWNEGKLASVKDVFTVVPELGTVLVTIKDSNGNIVIDQGLLDELNIGKLNSLSAGKYVLIAYVEGDDRFDELTAEIDFVIMEDTVGQSVLMALTITFAVIAIALSVVAVILLVRKDKKTEKEFLEMVKAELRRK